MMMIIIFDTPVLQNGMMMITKMIIMMINLSVLDNYMRIMTI